MQQNNYWPPRTFDEAQRINPYELAERWSHCIDQVTPIAELAAVCALRAQLTRMLPTQLHRALAGGATVEQVCAASDLTATEVSGAWHRWAEFHRPWGAHYRQISAMLDGMQA